MTETPRARFVAAIREWIKRGDSVSVLAQLEAAEKERDDLANTISGVLCDAGDIPVPANTAAPGKMDDALRVLLQQRDEARRALAERGHVAGCNCRECAPTIKCAYSDHVDIGNGPHGYHIDPRCAPAGGGPR